MPSSGIGCCWRPKAWTLAGFAADRRGLQAVLLNVLFARCEKIPAVEAGHLAAIEGGER